MTDSEIKEIQLVSLESACIKEKHSNEENDVREFIFKLSGSVNESWKCYLKQYCNKLIGDIENNIESSRHDWLLVKYRDFATKWKNSDYKEIKNFLNIANFCGDKLLIKSTKKDLINMFVLMGIIQTADNCFREREKAAEEILITAINGDNGDIKNSESSLSVEEEILITAVNGDIKDSARSCFHKYNISNR